MLHVNYLAVLTSAAVIFILGGLWYSPALFAKPWLALTGKKEEDLRANARWMPVLYTLAFVCGLLTALTMAVILNHFTELTALRGALVGVVCWVGFAGATSFANALFSKKPMLLWLIDSGYNLVSFIIAGIILAVWR